MIIAVITPITHLKGVRELLINKGIVIMEEESSKRAVRKTLLERDVDTILCNPNQQTYKIDEELLRDTKVKLINSCSTGLNHIDLEYCNQNNIEIQCHKNDYELINELPSTSELAFGLMMSLLRSIPQGSQHVKSRRWDYTQFVGRQVKDLKIGIIGYGRLGKMMYNFCKAFEADVMVFDPYVGNIGCSSIEDMLSKCDVISLHVHVTEETKYMINERLLGFMKKNSYIINTSRGEIVDEQAIINQLGQMNDFFTPHKFVECTDQVMDYNA